MTQAESSSKASTNYGYARVSAKDQNLARQHDALTRAGIAPHNTFSDKASGKSFQRPAYQSLVEHLLPGDVVFIKSIDRLGRSYEEIIEEWKRITREKGAHIVVLDMPILDTRASIGGITGTFLTDIVLQVLSYVAQIERENNHQRQAEGIAAARTRGVQFGRPKIRRPRIYRKTKEAYLAGEITRGEAAVRLKVSKTTFDTWCRQDRLKPANH